MNASKRILSSIVGEEGYETLEKAIFKRGTSAVIDPLEFFLPLMVVPRAILSWLVENVQPMKPGEIKDIPFPGKPDISIHIEKQAVDQYRCEFTQKGRVIHEFEKQALPVFGAHLLTVGESYDSFADKPKEEPKDDSPPKQEAPEEMSSHSADVVRTIMHEGEVSVPERDSEQIKWMVQHANVRELTGVIGKLVDALIAKKTMNDSFDKSDEPSSKGDPQKIETSKTPEEKFKEDMKAKDLPIDTEGQFKAAIENAKEIDKIKDTPPEDQKPPECKVVPAGTKAADATVKKDEIAPVKKRSVREALMKPYVSDAQRRWAHTATGTKALGGKEAVHHWDKESKGKDLPEKVSKAGEMPGGAGQPKVPLKPQAPKPPVPPGHDPSAQASKQAEAAGKGKQVMPHTPGTQQPHNSTTMKPQAPKPPTLPKMPMPKIGGAPKLPSMKAPAMGKAEGYFRSKLRPVQKAEQCKVTSEELFKSKCVHCNKPEFKEVDNKPVFNPCACFVVTKSDEEGKPYKFV
jgi:hypothetical protein